MSNPSKPRKFAEGTGMGRGAERATVRALDAYMALGSRADRLAEVIEDAEPPPPAPPTKKKHDSLIIALATFRDS